MVTDTGEGMDKETSARIFEPFFSTKKTGSGYGLGLAMVQEIVTVHGGRVGVKSKLGSGSRFAVYLPSVEEPKGRTKPSLRPKPFKSKPPSEDHRHVIMLVDDEQAVRRSLRRLLQRAGYTIIEAEHGNEALQLYPRHKPTPELVIIDLDMPELSGEETQRLLRELNPSARVLFLSGHKDPRREATIIEDGALGFIEKPCQATDLLAAVAEALSHEERPPTKRRGAERRTSQTLESEPPK